MRDEPDMGIHRHPNRINNRATGQIMGRYRLCIRLVRRVLEMS